jgi:hypothetical protein
MPLVWRAGGQERLKEAAGVAYADEHALLVAPFFGSYALLSSL